MALITPNDGIGYDPTSYDGDLIESNRSIILSATKDSLDQPPAEVAEGEDTVDETTMSIASTVDVDNTSCYLRRFAVKFALEKRKHEEVETIFVKINKYKMDQDVIYTGHGSHDRARIVDVYYEDNNKPRYNIELCDGYIEAHVGEDQLERLDKTKDYGIDENTSAPPIPTLRQHKDYATSKVVNFESNPTLLFSSLYNGDYEAAKDRLASHPEEASIWVVRYSTHSNQQNADHEHCSTHQSIRWKLLPLHLFIILAGSHDYNHLDSDEALMLGAAAPPLELLTALISAYPHATKCIDDQHMIPLYASIRGHSSPRIIQALINASPESVSWKDVKGRDAFVLLDQVFKRLMKQAVVNAEEGDETHDALKIREWKQEVLNLLNDVTLRNTPTEISNPFDEKVNSPRQIHRLQMNNNLFDTEQALNEMEPNITCKEQGNSDYLQLQFTRDESTVTKDITPCSTMTSTTEVTTPTSVDNKKESSKAPEAVASMNWEARCQMLELESCDSEDRADTLVPSDRAVTTLEGADSSSIFRAREAQHEETVRRSNVVTGSSGSNISQYPAKNTENVSKGAEVSVFDSSTILAAIFSYDSEDEGHPNAVCPNAFAKEAMPPMSGRMSNLP